jgi:site-specific DNA recombinase
VRPTDTPTRAVIYTRISRDDSGEGKSNRRQEDECRRLTDYRRWDVVGVVDDISRSAYKRGVKREGWQRVLRMVERGEVDVIVVYHLDRVTRNMRDLEDLLDLVQKYGVGTATVVGDIDMTGDMGRMLARILAAVATAEVERKSTRQKDANKQRRAEGLPWQSGWRAFGYELDGTLIPAEAALIREAASDVLAGASLKSIARRWRDLGVSTPRSAKGAEGWTHNGVRSILLNPKNAGLSTYKGEIIGKGAWEPILSEDTHTLLVARLTDPVRRTNGNGRKAANLLSGIAKCATCEEPVIGGTVGRSVQVAGKRKATGERVQVYKCKNDHLSTVRDDADEIVRTAFALAVRATRPGLLMPIHRKGADASALQTQAQQISDDLNALSSSFASRRITLEQLETASAALLSQRDSVERQISDGHSGEVDARVLRDENVRRFLEHDLDNQRAILSRLAEIRLYPKGRGKKNVPITEQVTMHLRAVRQPTKKYPEPEEYLIPALAERG